MFRLNRPSARVCLSIVGLASALLVGSFAPGRAHAQFAACYSDPVVSMTNLGQLDLSASIGDNTSDVSQIVYILHAPVGTHLIATIPTDGLVGLKEKFVFYADNPANTYDVHTYVFTGSRGVAVTAQSLAVSLPTTGLSLASGYSGQDLHTHLYGLLSGLL